MEVEIGIAQFGVLKGRVSCLGCVLPTNFIKVDYLIISKVKKLDIKGFRKIQKYFLNLRKFFLSTF